MKIKNQLPLQRLIGKIDNDFNIDNSDWIPRVGAWVIDALSQMKCLPMEYKKRELDVIDRVAIFPCTLNVKHIQVFDKNGCEIKSEGEIAGCACDDAIPSTGGSLLLQFLMQIINIKLQRLLTLINNLLVLMFL